MRTSFRLLSELYSLLFTQIKHCDILNPASSFPSPLGVIFSLIKISDRVGNWGWICFRLLSELYSLLFYIYPEQQYSCHYLVSVSSRSYILSYSINAFTISDILTSLFPSPLGVIFSLIFNSIFSALYIFVSVSSRSYILSYV